MELNAEDSSRSIDLCPHITKRCWGNTSEWLIIVRGAVTGSLTQAAVKLAFDYLPGRHSPGAAQGFAAVGRKARASSGTSTGVPKMETKKRPVGRLNDPSGDEPQLLRQNHGVDDVDHAVSCSDIGLDDLCVINCDATRGAHSQLSALNGLDLAGLDVLGHHFA